MMNVDSRKSRQATPKAMHHDTDESRPPAKRRLNGRPWRTAATSAPPPHSPASTDDEGERWTVGRLLNWTTDYLKRRGSESARLDAEVLLAKALGWSRVQLYTHFEEEVGEIVRATYREMV